MSTNPANPAAPQVRPDHIGEFEVSYTRTGPKTVELRIGGDLDLATTERVDEAIEIVLGIDDPHITEIEIDLSGVSFIDSSGYAPLTQLQESLRMRGGNTHVRYASASVARLMNVIEELADRSTATRRRRGLG